MRYLWESPDFVVVWQLKSAGLKMPPLKLKRYKVKIWIAKHQRYRLRGFKTLKCVELLNSLKLI